MRYMIVPKKNEEVYDHGKDIVKFHQICEDFKNSLKKDPKIHNNYIVTSVSKVSVESLVSADPLISFLHL